MATKVPEPGASQAHKPLQRFVAEIVGELSQMYQPLHRYHTKQRILIPMPDSDDEDYVQPSARDVTSGEVSGRHGHKASEQRSFDARAPGENDLSKSQGENPIKNVKEMKRNGELVVLKTRHGERQTFLKRNKNLIWHCAPPER